MTRPSIELKIRMEETPFQGSKLYVPTGEGPHPGVLLLHGSGGGTHSAYQLLALYLAAHGYAALAYSYYGSNDGVVGPRETLGNIELLKTYEAFTWLKKSRFVSGRKVALHGTSRGAEQALLLASLLPGTGFEVPDAVAVHAPTEVVWGSWNWDWDDQRCWFPDPNDSSKKLWNPNCGPNPIDLSEEENIAWRWQGQPLALDARIEVEKYPGPYFITHGTSDQIWEVEKTRKIESTLKKADCLHECHYFEGEGHQLGLHAENRRNELLVNFLGRHLGVK
jgi:dienelactone hydrolase